jgi:hypothetical protein
MYKKIVKFRSALVLILGLSMLCFGTLARADGDRGERYRHGNYNYRHHDGMWYAHDEVVVRSAPSVQVNL